jgi:hypothetical protein
VSPHWGAPNGPSSQAGWSRRIDVLSMFHVSNVSLAAATACASSPKGRRSNDCEGATC